MGRNKEMEQSPFTALINFTWKDGMLYLEGDRGFCKVMSVFSGAI